MPAAAPIYGQGICHGQGLGAAALMADFVDSSRTEAKRRGGGSMPAAAPDGNLGFFVGFFPERRGGGSMAAAARGADLVLFCILSADLKGILGIFVPIGF